MGGALWRRVLKSEQENTRSEIHKGQMGWFSSNLLKPWEKGKVDLQPDIGHKPGGVSVKKRHRWRLRTWWINIPIQKRRDLTWEEGEMVKTQNIIAKLGLHSISSNPCHPFQRERHLEKYEKSVSILEPKKICFLNYTLKSFTHLSHYPLFKILTLALYVEKFLKVFSLGLMLLLLTKSFW